jgi:hypothetical protein
MGIDRKSLGAWASAAAESLLRDDRVIGLPDDVTAPRENADPYGSPCRYYTAGHKPHHIPAMHAGWLRREGGAEAVRYVGHALVASSSLVWADDAVPGSDTARIVVRLELERTDGTSYRVVTHDTRGLAPIEACGGEGLWLIPRYSTLLVPSWDDTLTAADRDGEPTSWPTLSVAEEAEPWHPCPVAPPKTSRGRALADR